MAGLAISYLIYQKVGIPDTRLILHVGIDHIPVFPDLSDVIPLGAGCVGHGGRTLHINGELLPLLIHPQHDRKSAGCQIDARFRHLRRITEHQALDQRKLRRIGIGIKCRTLGVRIDLGCREDRLTLGNISHSDRHTSIDGIRGQAIRRGEPHKFARSKDRIILGLKGPYFRSIDRIPGSIVRDLVSARVDLAAAKLERLSIHPLKMNASLHRARGELKIVQSAGHLRCLHIKSHIGIPHRNSHILLVHGLKTATPHLSYPAIIIGRGHILDKSGDLSVVEREIAVPGHG